MKTRWFLVVLSRGLWWVDCEGRSFGPFDNVDEAKAAAVRYAGTFADEARQSQVWAPDDSGRLQQVWASEPP